MSLTDEELRAADEEIAALRSQLAECQRLLDVRLAATVTDAEIEGEASKRAACARLIRAGWKGW